MQRLAAILAVVFTVAYPIIVYVGITQGSTRQVSLGLLLLVAAMVVVRSGRRGSPDARSLGGTSGRWAAIRHGFGPLLPTFVGASAAAALDSHVALLAVPVLVNGGLLATFAATLRPGHMPMVERFARIQEPSLPDDRVPYCRGVTRVWVGFFAVNALLSAALALFAPVRWWALWCGAVAYVCIGLLFAGEWWVRRRRFPRQVVPS